MVLIYNMQIKYILFFKNKNSMYNTYDTKIFFHMNLNAWSTIDTSDLIVIFG